MTGQTEHMFVVGLLAGLSVAARQAAGSPREQHEWHNFLDTVRRVVRQPAEQIGPDRVRQLERVLEDYAPTRDALRVILSTTA